MAKQNVFSAKIGLEKENVPTKYVNIPIILRGEDLYLKSGQNGLLTENAAGAMFDGFKIDHEDCFVEESDSEKLKHYVIKTNRFHELYRSDIVQIWDQHKDDTNPWEYKQNFYLRKTVLWKKPQEEEKYPPALLDDRQFDTGTISFEILFQKAENQLDFHMYWSSSRDNIQISLSPTKIKIVQHENGEPNVLFNGKI